VSGDLELEIGAGPERGRYVVRVVRAPSGGEPVAELHLDVDELLDRRPDLERTLLASAVSAASRRVVPLTERPVLEVGRRLFEALFTGPVYGAYRASLGVAQERNQRLRLVLRLRAPELAALPWEMLFDPETGTYLCRQEPLVRHVPAPFTPEPLEARLPLRVLGLVASPRGLPLLDSDAERQHLEAALAAPIAAGQIELEWVAQASWHGVHERLLSGHWHVLHFVGHGDYDPHTEQGRLAFVGPTGRPDLIDANRLADLFSETDETRLVVLNSCSSGESGVEDLFSGTAAALVRSGISAVAAMQFTISDNAAIAFSRGFYAALANDRTIDQAVRSGRIAILGTPGTLEWLTPVLYVRGDVTHLFNFAPGGPVRSRPDTRTLLVQARAELRVDNYDAAVGLLDDVLALDPVNAAATELMTTARQRAERSGQVADLLAELRLHAAAERWQAVADVDDELGRLDPAATDPDGLATRARRMLTQPSTRAARLLLQVSHHDEVSSVAFSPDGTRLATGGGDGIVSIWDAGTGEEQLRLGHEQFVLTVAFSPGGTRLATGGGDGKARIWDAVTGELFWEFAHGEWVHAVAFNAHGTSLATGSRDATARIWDVVTGAENLRVSHADAVYAVALSPDGKRLATGCADGNVRIWDAATGEQRLLLGHASGVPAVAFNADGTRLATGGYDDTARIWDATTGLELSRFLHAKLVHAALSRDGTLLATGSYDEGARIWPTVPGGRQLEIPHTGGVYALAFSPDGTRLATGSNDETARIWQI
jgi:5-formyltetrahydrofolate cyclo-ligase